MRGGPFDIERVELAVVSGRMSALSKISCLDFVIRRRSRGAITRSGSAARGIRCHVSALTKENAYGSRRSCGELFDDAVLLGSTDLRALHIRC